jgi:HNH endonuclease
VTRMTYPTAEAQVAFLGAIERLLAEGQFVATYKYALLVALVELAVEVGHDDARPLDIPVRSLGAKFLELYWRQCVPYGAAVGNAVNAIPRQNTGAQASIFTIVGRLRIAHPTLAAARRSPSWQKAVTEATQLVERMPLWRLQVLRNETLEFLYATGDRGAIRLLPGVSANLRRFQGMILRLAQSEWLRFVQALPANATLLGATSDLGQFMFGADRTALTRMIRPLAEIQRGVCLYCERPVKQGEIDHFVPWSRYPRDLAHNLVLAHRECNRRKSDLVAAEPHLERWMARNATAGTLVASAGREAGLVVDPLVALSVARWLYAHSDAIGASTWLRADVVEPLTGRWRVLLPP